LDLEEFPQITRSLCSVKNKRLMGKQWGFSPVCEYISGGLKQRVGWTISDLHLSNVGLVSVIGTETRYDVDGTGIESRLEREFSHPSTPALGPPSILHNGYRIITGGKAAEAWHWRPIPSSVKVKVSGHLYLYSPSLPSWQDIGRILPFFI
jgi:hypothetical protein